MVGAWFGGVFFAVVVAYICTEFLLIRFDARRRILVGEGNTLPLILGVNSVSFAVLWAGGLVLVAVSDAVSLVAMTVVCLLAQAVWLGQHLWFYYRDHLRLSYEN